jgi:hypothetical protein
MRFDKFTFGSIQIDGVTCDYDLIEAGISGAPVYLIRLRRALYPARLHRRQQFLATQKQLTNAQVTNSRCAFFFSPR